MRIDVVFDTVCPWCYIGKRRLERALAMRRRVRTEIRWRPFLLDSDVPSEGIERRVYLERKFGSPHRVQRVFNAVTAAGTGEGILFNFTGIARTPNSTLSHRLVRCAEQFGRDTELVEDLFSAYFTYGRDIGDREVLLAIAERLDLPEPAVLIALDEECDQMTMLAEKARAHRLGVNGIPCFIFNGVYAIAGAQESEVLVRMIDLAEETQFEPVMG